MTEWKWLTNSSTTEPLYLSTQTENKPILELGLKVDAALQQYFASDRKPASEFEAHSEAHFSEIAIEIDQGKTHALTVAAPEVVSSPVEQETSPEVPEMEEGEQLESVI